MNSKEHIICKKDNIILKKNLDNNTYSLKFDIRNNNIIIKEILNVHLIVLLCELNKDIVESGQILNINSNNTSANILFIFKQFGNEMGIPKKYINLQIDVREDNNNVYLESKTTNSSVNLPKNCEEIVCKFFNLNVTNIKKHSSTFEYILNIDIKEDLPIYLENIIGVLIKKIFINTKLFIENLK